jgi:hypothetical protein
LEVLYLEGPACTATSLQGLAGLNSLIRVIIAPYDDGDGCELRSLEGISSGVKELCISNAPGLVSLVGIESCTSMQTLSLKDCGIHSFQPLRGLSSLKYVAVSHAGNLSCLEGLNSMALHSLRLQDCSSLVQLSGIEHLSALKSLEVLDCGVTSLQPLSQLGKGLQRLTVLSCPRVQEEVIELPHVQPTAEISLEYAGAVVKEVVLAGGVRRCVRPAYHQQRA